MSQTMQGRNTLRGSAGECYATIEGNRYLLMQIKKVEARFEKGKAELGIMGRPGKVHKSTGWNGTGTATLYFNTSIFRDMMYRFKETGEDIYFDMQFTNEDTASGVGRQTVILKDCNIDGGILALLDVDAEYLEEDVDFTFDDFEYPEKFKLLQGMV